MFVPAASRRVLRSSLLAYNGLRPRARRWGRFVALAASSGPGRARLGDPLSLAGGTGARIVAHCAEALGQPTLTFAVGTPHADAWWKPTLQLFSPQGRPAGYAKVGHSPVTAQLVRNEAAGLTAVSALSLGSFAAPELVAAFEIDGYSVTLTQPMPPKVRRARSGELDDARCIHQLSGLGSDLKVAPSIESPWWRTLEGLSSASVAPELSDRGEPSHVESAQLAFGEALARAEQSIGSQPGRCGPWHGDWVPWNTAIDAATGVGWVWDWEYFAPFAPVGMDLVHRSFQIHHVLNGRSIPDALRLSSMDTDEQLRQMGLESSEVAVLRLAHPLELAARYLRSALLGAPTVDESIEFSRYITRANRDRTDDA